MFEKEVICENRLSNKYRKQFKFFQVRIVKGAKSNIFTCKLWAGKLFLKNTRIPSRTNHKTSKVQHFDVQTVMHIDCSQ